jgi:hypothetical protein
MKMLKIDAVLGYKQRSTCLHVLISTAIHAKLHFVTPAWSPHTFNPSHTEIVWEERRLMGFLKFNGNLVAARCDSTKIIFLKGPRKQKNRLWDALELCTFCISTWVSATMRLGFYMHVWFVISLKEPPGIAPRLSIAGLFLCVLTENSLVVWLEKSIDEWSICMTFYRIYEQ